MPNYDDVYQDANGDFWQFDPPYDDDDDYIPEDDYWTD